MRDKWDNVLWKRFWANTSIWSKHSQNTRFLASSGERNWSRTWLATPGDSVAWLWQRNPSPLLLYFILNEESMGMDLWDSATDRPLWQQNSYKGDLAGGLEIWLQPWRLKTGLHLRAEVRNSFSSPEGGPFFQPAYYQATQWVFPRSFARLAVVCKGYSTRLQYNKYSRGDSYFNYCYA